MFHPDTQFLIDHWISLAAQPDARGGVPFRSRLFPDALGLRLPRIFMAERRDGDLQLRLVGSWIESLHGSNLTAQSLPSLWRAQSRAMIESTIQRSIDDSRPIVINATVGDAATPLEITVAPLRSMTGRIDRLLGLYVPLSTLTLTEGESRLLTGRFARTTGGGRPLLSLAAVDGRRVA